MSAWRKIAFAGVVCSPAVLVVASFATAVETAYDPVAASAYEVTPEDAEKVSPEVAGEEPPLFTEEFMLDPANVAAGREVWQGTCAGCHGARAYPGKAPKLKPKKYTPGFVFHQATFGGKKMPPFGDVFTREERMAVVTWVLSKDFAP